MTSLRSLVFWLYFVMLLLVVLTDLGHCEQTRNVGILTPPPNIDIPQDDYVRESANISWLLHNIMKGYDKRIMPNVNGRPVNVSVSFLIWAVNSISEVDMDYTLVMYYRRTWIDKRLAFRSSKYEEITVGNEMLNRFWLPDMFFSNSKQTQFNDFTMKNAMLRIQKTGEVMLSLSNVNITIIDRLTVTAMCNMDFTYFPMDTQICSLAIESYAYAAHDMTIRWVMPVKRAVRTSRTMCQLPQFEFRGIKTERVTECLDTGCYERLVCKFLFVRRLGHYIIQIYVPSCLLVILSWVSFWLNRDAVPARVTLGITTVLSLTTLLSNTNASLPKISYMKSIDVYLVTCFFMVFASLIEYTVVSYMSNQPKIKLAREVKQSDGKEHGTVIVPPHHMAPVMYRKYSLDHTEDCEMLDPVYLAEMWLTSLRKRHTEYDVGSNLASGSLNDNDSLHSSHAYFTPQESVDPPSVKNDRIMQPCVDYPHMIDKYSRALFPLVFFIFNLIYWITYLTVSAKEDLSDFRDSC